MDHIRYIMLMALFSFGKGNPGNVIGLLDGFANQLY